jgi:Cytochrome P460
MVHHRAVRLRILAIVAVVAAVAAVAVVAVASTSANGLPSYTNGYAKWPRINGKPFTSTGPLSSAHAGVKNVYASRKKVGKRYPHGTVIVKSIRRAGDKPSLPAQVAVMRKTNGTWRYVEYELSGSRYRDLGFTQQLCQGCHMRARANDYVFTK